MKNRTLYFGDNLEILREKFTGDDGYFDLIYLDPPFNSNRSYNVLFKEGLVENHAQIRAFEDSWHWSLDTERTFEELIGARQSKTERTLHDTKRR
jgi:site-specific DNA-methyltransferase (adenine-specific)